LERQIAREACFLTKGVATRVELLEILLPDVPKELNGILLEPEPNEKNVLLQADGPRVQKD
jgi:hypothetical protein